MRKDKKLLILLMLTVCTVCALSGCKKKASEDETESAQTTAASSVRETAAAASGALNGDSAIVPVAVSYETGTALTDASGKSSVSYPVLEDVSDGVNALIQKNAESILSAYAPGEEDELSMNCDVIALDKSRATIIYQGTFKKGQDDAIKIFCSNTVDLSKASDITLRDLADTATVASYILSDDCYFTNLAGNLSSEAKEALMDARTSMTLSQYESLLKNADFPVSLDTSTYFPGTFSFEKDGVIYFTVPVSHDLGDYAMITYAPETK